MSNTVRVEFNPPRTVKAVRESWLLTADDEPDVFLPRSQTELEFADSPAGQLVEAATIPRFIAEDRGLVVVDCTQENNNDDERDAMTRRDWFVLGLTMAMLIREPKLELWDVTLEVKKLANDLMAP